MPTADHAQLHTVQYLDPIDVLPAPITVRWFRLGGRLTYR